MSNSPTSQHHIWRGSMEQRQTNLYAGCLEKREGGSSLQNLIGAERVEQAARLCRARFVRASQARQ